MDNKKKNNVPRGLSELLKSTNNFDKIEKLSKKTKEEGMRRKISIDKLIANPFQPRLTFDEVSLNELAQSIKQHGLIQPVIVRRSKDINYYEIIAGERRVRAARIAKLDQIDVIVQNWDDKTTRQMTLLENIQRENLNHIEVAKSYQSLIKELDISKSQLATVVAKNRTTVTNFLRLLDLPPKAKKLVEENKISGSFARALLALKDPDLIDAWATKDQIQIMSVNALEKKIKTYNLKQKENDKLDFDKDVHLVEAENLLSEYFDTNVKLGKKLSKGKITISYNSSEQLTQILKKLNKDFEL